MSAQKILHWLDSFESYISQILLAFFVCVLFTQIFLRVAFDYVITWSEEISRFSFVWFVFFGASYAARLGAHNRVTVQFKLFPPAVAKYSMLFADLIWIGFNAVMIRESFKVIENLREFKYHSPALGISMEYIYWIFPICFGLMIIRIIQVNWMRFVLKIELADVDKVNPEDLAEQIGIPKGSESTDAGCEKHREAAR